MTASTLTIGRPALACFASLGLMERRLSPVEVEIVARALTEREPQTGAAPLPAEAAHALDDAGRETCRMAVRAWLALTDSQLWTNLSSSAAHEPNLADADLLAVLRLAQTVHARSSLEQSITAAYVLNWTIAARIELMMTLRSLGSVPDVCDYMSTFRTNQGMPPFMLGAELALAALQQPESGRSP